ncbi:MAG: hypothetical protein ACRDNT_22165 [Streptosporangiaceae bacterium]
MPAAADTPAEVLARAAAARLVRSGSAGRPAGLPGRHYEYSLRPTLTRLAVALDRRAVAADLAATPSADHDGPGAGLAEQARTDAPGAKYLLLTAYADTDVAIKAINDIGLDYYLLKPWDPPEERLYPVIDDLLGDWRQANPDHTSDVRVIGHRWSDRSAQRLRDLADAMLADLPPVLVPDGDTLRSPSTLELTIDARTRRGAGAAQPAPARRPDRRSARRAIPGQYRGPHRARSRSVPRRRARGLLVAAHRRFTALDTLRGEIEPQTAVQDPLALSDHEEAMSSWLSRHGIVREWLIAPPLAAAGVDLAWCEPGPRGATAT